MKTSQLIATVCSLFLLLAATFAQTSEPNPGLAADPVFQKNCAKCHGSTATGRHFGGPSLVSAKTTSMAPAALRNIITSGRGRMPKYGTKLTGEEIDALVQQIKAMGRN